MVNFSKQNTAPLKIQKLFAFFLPKREIKMQFQLKVATFSMFETNVFTLNKEENNKKMLHYCCCSEINFFSLFLRGEIKRDIFSER